MTWNRKKLKPPRPIPKMNIEKVKEEVENRIKKLLKIMMWSCPKTHQIHMLYEFMGIITPIPERLNDYGSLPYSNMGAVRNKSKAECLFSMLARVYMYWWDFLSGKNELGICKRALINLEHVVNNFDQYELRYTDKLGYRLCKIKPKKS